MANTHVELAGSWRPLREGAQRIGDVDPHATIEITVTLTPTEEPKVEAVLGTPLTAEEQAKQFGADPKNVERVERVLDGYGLTVNGVSSDRRSVRMSGPTAAAENAFGTRLGIYHESEQGDYRGREGWLMIPSELSGIVTGVFGLDQRQVAERHAAGVTAPAFGLKTAELEAHYNFPPGDGNGQAIAIAEFGTPVQPGTVVIPAFIPEDLAAFCRLQGRSTPAVRIVPVNIAPITREELDAQTRQNKEFGEDLFDLTAEVMMDVEIVAGLCPKAEISIYFATFDQKGWIDLLDKVTSGEERTPVCLSISYGMAEESPDWSAAAIQEINFRLQKAAMQGITVCVSSGDDGSGADMNGNRAHVEFPTSSPFVCSVGGTMLNDSAEVVWFVSPGRRNNKGGGATGGGVSVVFDRPSWQNIRVPSLNRDSIDGRVLPDVAALAGSPGYEMILLGQRTQHGGGGTSASAPLWASLVARVNAALPESKRQRFLPPLLYQNGPGGAPRGSAACRDITSGQNASSPHPGKGYSATPGFDAVSGWGVPDGQALLAALRN
jgi:kumamolisin